MIKYILQGSFIDENNKEYKVDAKTFMNEKPIKARKEALNWLDNWKSILTDMNNLKFTQDRQLIIEDQAYNFTKRYGIKVIAVIYDEEYTVDYFGAVSPGDYDTFAHDLMQEFDDYKEKELEIDKKQQVTYCDMGEFTEGYEDTAIETFDHLETSIDLSGKEEPYWWLDDNDKLELIKKYIKNRNKLKDSEENHFVEFKPSLLYNFKTQRPSMKVKYVNAKAICAFLNSSGGKLYIGLNDNGEAQGLEISDYKIAAYNQKDPKDYIRVQFDSLMHYYFTKDIHEFVRSDFHVIGGRSVFVVDIKPSNAPVFLRNKKEDIQVKEFYIRTTASSEMIRDQEQIVNYCFSHWKG